MFEWSAQASSMAEILMHPVGLPIAASGIAHSIPVVTPAPDAGPQPWVTPARLLSITATRMPNGFVPPVSVPSPPQRVPPRNWPVPAPPVGNSAAYADRRGQSPAL